MNRSWLRGTLGMMLDRYRGNNYSLHVQIRFCQNCPLYCKDRHYAVASNMHKYWVNGRSEIKIEHDVFNINSLQVQTGDEIVSTYMIVVQLSQV